MCKSSDGQADTDDLCTHYDPIVGINDFTRNTMAQAILKPLTDSIMANIGINAYTGNK